MKIRTRLRLAAAAVALVAGCASLLAAAPAANAATKAGTGGVQPLGFYYQTVRNWHSGQCLTGFGTVGKHVVEQWTCWDYTAQQWRIAPTDNGWFRLIVASTGDCMEVEGASQDNNHKVVKNLCNYNYNQQWMAVSAPIGGGYVFLVARHSGKCLAILSESLEVGADMVQYSCSPYSPVIDPIGGSYWRFV